MYSQTAEGEERSYELSGGGQFVLAGQNRSRLLLLFWLDDEGVYLTMDKLTGQVAETPQVEFGGSFPAIDDDYLYWAEPDYDPFITWRLYRQELDSNAPRELLWERQYENARGMNVALTDSHVLLLGYDIHGGDVVRTIPKEGGAETSTGSVVHNALCVVSDGMDTLIWTKGDFVDPGAMMPPPTDLVSRVLRIDESGAMTELDTQYASGIAITSEALLWTRYDRAVQCPPGSYVRGNFAPTVSTSVPFELPLT